MQLDLTVNSIRMPFPGGRIIGAIEENDTREGNQHPHIDDLGECHWIPIFVGVLCLIIMITVIMIYKCLWKRRGNAFLQRRCSCNEHEFAVDDEE